MLAVRLGSRLQTSGVQAEPLNADIDVERVGHSEKYSSCLPSRHCDETAQRGGCPRCQMKCSN